jgi:hypothetical protein
MSEEAAVETAPEAAPEVAVEATPDTVVESLPDAGNEPASFSDALEQALEKMGAEAPEPEPEVAPEPEPEPEAETAPEPEAAEKTTEEAEVAPLDQLSEDVGDDWTPKAASRFKQLKAELKNSSSELETLRQKSVEHEARIKELSAINEADDPKALQEKLAQYEQEKMFTNLEETEAYKQRVTKPLRELLDSTEAVAEKYGIDAEALVDAVALTDEAEQDKALEGLLELATDRDKSRIYRVIENIEPLMAVRKAMHDNVEQAVAEAKEADEQKQKQKLATQYKVREQVATEVGDRVSEKLPFLKAVEGFDMSAAKEAAVNSDPTTIHPVDHAYNTIASQILPTVVREYASMRKEIEVLTDRLAEFEGAEPTAGHIPSSAAGLQQSSDNLSFEESISAAFSSLPAQ